MANTRTDHIGAVWADSATTTIPATPVVGTSYRDAATTDATIEAGAVYGRVQDSSEFNEAVHNVASVLRLVDQQGILGWSEDVDYSSGAVVRGSDGTHYIATGASGPASTVNDPITDTGGTWDTFSENLSPQSQIAQVRVRFIGTGTPAIVGDDVNVDSISDNGTGRYTVNYTNNLTDANYSPFVSGNLTGTTMNANQGAEYNTAAAGSCGIMTVSDRATNIAADFAEVNLVVFGGV